jgi:hypothetical protein
VSARALLLVAFLALLVALLLVFVGLPHRDWRTPAPPPATTTLAAAEPAPSRPAVAHFGEVCARHQTRFCDGGDAWWLDGCGRREELAERCDDAYCEAGRCLQPSPGPSCGNLSEGGRCDGDILRWCERGRARAVDCAASELRCARARDGEPNCVKPAPCTRDACSGAYAGVCEGGQRHVSHCGPGFTCELDDNHRARCLRRVDADWLHRAPCQGCACPSPGPEDLLPPIPIVAFLVSDDLGFTAESEERVRLEIDLLRYWFEITHPTGLRFFLQDVRKLSRPRWLSATDATMREASRDPELHPPDQPFFVPLVFVRDLKIGAKSTPGVGLLPGATCADLLPLPDVIPDDGVILIGRLRNLSTVAHELGHYFGLCHTHQADPTPPRVTLRDDGSAVDCTLCGQSGDGVCDTAVDPGLESCTLDEERCTVSCLGGATPDPANLMSYFVPCRRVFSDEQAAYMRRFARLRLRAHGR